MDGITILNEIVNTIEPLPMGTWIFLLGLVIMGTISLVICFIVSIKEDCWGLLPALVLCGLLFGCAWWATFLSYEDTQREPYTITQYEVTLSNDISLTEFNKKYEIIEQRGDIYVIQEKEKIDEQN
jgi:hypothetical protein